MSPGQPKRAFIKGALWTIGGRWLVRVMGVLNTLVLARILMPSDYGVVAMAMLLVGLIQAVSDMGVATALLRNKDADEQDINSAWTLRCLQGLAMAAITIAAAPVAAWFFNEPRVQAVLLILAACMALEGFGSLGWVLAQRQFDFSLDFRLQIVSKASAVLAGWATALVIADYRALVAGIVVGYVVNFFLAYALHPFRPQWTTSRIPDIWRLTKWLMLSSVALFLLRRSDELIAAKIAPTASFGAYHVGSDIGRAPVGEIGPPLMKAFLPVLASFREDRERVNAVVLKTLAATITVTMPVAIGMWSLSELFVQVVMGEKWLEAAPFLAVYALVSLVQFAATPLSTLLILHGHTQTQSKAAWLELSVFVVATLLLLPGMQLMGLVWARFLASSINLMSMMAFARQRTGLQTLLVFKAFWRPAFGSVLMALVLALLAPVLAGPQWLQLLTSIAAGMVVYTAWSLASWPVFGRPEGLESTVVDFLKKRLQR
jgi:O-antigen/teichoic acid export membrane protein